MVQSGIRTGVALLLLVVGPLLSSGDGKFELSSEREILTIPYGGPVIGWGAPSPDGKTVLVIKAGALAVRSVESSVEKELLPKGSIAGALGVWACWSPDGKSIYYLQGAGVGKNDLWRLRIATLKKELVIKDAGGVFNANPSPSPDGKSIAFYRDKVLMLVRADGANQRVLCDHCDPSRIDMAWSPDSSQIVSVPRATMVADRKSFLVNVATGETKSLQPPKGYVMSMSWPSWSSGPFLCLSVVTRGENGKYKQQGIPIFYLALPQEAWTQITPDPAYYIRIFGSGSEPNTLIAQRMQPPPSGWDFALNALDKMGLPLRAEFQPTVLLTLRKQ